MAAAWKGNIERVTRGNRSYRRVLATTAQQQLVVMALGAGEEIGTEVHPRTTQFVRVEGGAGHAIVNGRRYMLRDGDALVIPAGARHNIVAGRRGLQLYTVYAPPEHARGLRQLRKEDDE